MVHAQYNKLDPAMAMTFREAARVVAAAAVAVGFLAETQAWRVAAGLVLVGALAARRVLLLKARRHDSSVDNSKQQLRQEAETVQLQPADASSHKTKTSGVVGKLVGADLTRQQRLQVSQYESKFGVSATAAEEATATAAAEMVSRLPLPPGPRSLPVLGGLLHMRGPGRTEVKLQRLARRYGPVMWIELGRLPTLVVSTPDAARVVLKEQDKLFSYRRKDAPTYAISRLLYYGTEFFNPHGPAWKFQVK